MKETYFPTMSEGNRSPEKISRREFTKLAAAILGGIGFGGAAYSGMKILEGLGLRYGNQEQLNENFFFEESKRLGRSTQTAATPTPFEPQPTSEATAEPSPTPEAPNAWKFAGIDFSDSSKQIDMAFFVGADTILVPSFIPFAYYNGALEDGAFAPDSNTGLTYLDQKNRKILNLHSGRHGPLDTQGFTMWGMQRYVEEYSSGVRRSPGETNNLLKSMIDTQPVVRQGSTSALLKVVAAVRIPPEYVSASQDHVFDIADWLRKEAPSDSGFGKIGDDKDTVVIKFCGRILTGEREVASRPSYQQSRFFIALKKN